VTIPFYFCMACWPNDGLHSLGAMTSNRQNQFGITEANLEPCGTRAHQVARFVFTEAPLQMLCESTLKGIIKSQENRRLYHTNPNGLGMNQEVLHGCC